MGVRVREAWLWPNGGRLGRAWVPDSPGGDALAQAGAVVGAQLLLLLAKHEVRLRSSSLQVLVHHEPASASEVELTVFDDLTEGGESARVNVPAAVAELTGEQRWWLAFDVLRSACEQLQQVTGEVPGPWQALAAEMLTLGPVQRLTSPWKASPDRRHRARVVSELRVDHHLGAMWIEIARRGEDVAIGRGPVSNSSSRRPPLAPTWQGSATASLALLVDHGGLLLEPGELTATVAELAPVEPLEAAGLPTRPQIPVTRVTRFSAWDPERPADVSIGDINGRPGLLPREHRRAWTAVGKARLPELRRWWAASGLATLYVSPVCVDKPPQATSSLDGRDLWVEVPLDPRVAAQREPDLFALDALHQAIHIAARRAKINPLGLSDAEDTATR
jgi:type II secretory pathway component PulJ